MSGSVAAEWLILTMGDRDRDVVSAVESIRAHSNAPVAIVANGASDPEVPGRLGDRLVGLAENIGVPAGRARGFESSSADVLICLDDDARVVALDEAALLGRFGAEPDLAVVGFRLVDPDGETARRHVPRAGSRGADRPADVATFLGGACAIRRSAYEMVGGYWDELFYGHEEVDISWRLHSAGFRVAYDPSVVIEHPKTEVGRHREGWRLTGRNRIMIARRNLPIVVCAIHVVFWLVLGIFRARGHRRAFVRGWVSGWSVSVTRVPVSWSTIVRLTRRGRPPIV